MKYVDIRNRKEFSSFSDAFDFYCCHKSICNRCPFKNYESCSEWAEENIIKALKMMKMIIRLE